MNKANKNKPGYKKTKIGWIPEDWKCVEFKKVVKFSQYGLSVASSDDGNSPVLGMANLQEGKIIPEEKQRVKLSDSEFDKYRIKKNDLLFNRTNSFDLVGKTALAIDDIPFVFASYIVRFVLLETIDPLFINYYFNKSDSIKRLKALATLGVSQCNINPTTLQKYFLIPLPPLPEQKKIARILSSWDNAIAQTQKLRAAKTQLKKGLMQQLLTGQMRFKEFVEDNHKKHEPHEIRKRGVPVGWHEVHLGDCFKERNETAPDLPLLSITSDKGVILRDDVERKDTSNADKSKYKKIMPGDIGYNTMRMWQGRSALSNLEGIVSPAYTVCTPKQGQRAEYYSYLFKYPHMIHLFHRFSQGLVSDTLNLKFHHFAQIRVIVPPEKEQYRIAHILQTCDKEINLLTQKEQALQMQKKGLMQKLLTGEIRVKV